MSARWWGLVRMCTPCTLDKPALVVCEVLCGQLYVIFTVGFWLIGVCFPYHSDNRGICNLAESLLLIVSCFSRRALRSNSRSAWLAVDQTTPTGSSASLVSVFNLSISVWCGKLFLGSLTDTTIWITELIKTSGVVANLELGDARKSLSHLFPSLPLTSSPFSPLPSIFSLPLHCPSILPPLSCLRNMPP